MISDSLSGLPARESRWWRLRRLPGARRDVSCGMGAMRQTYGSRIPAYRLWACLLLGQVVDSPDAKDSEETKESSEHQR